MIKQCVWGWFEVWHFGIPVVWHVPRIMNVDRLGGISGNTLVNWLNNLLVRSFRCVKGVEVLLVAGTSCAQSDKWRVLGTRCKY